MDLYKAKKIREKLHSIPEAANNEEKTSALIYSLLKETNPRNIYTNLGGHGLIAHYKGKQPGRSKMFRCELDAVPGPGGPQHLCGHDGHMTILITLASILAHGDFTGSVYLLFQPAEENGQGAARMIKDIEKLGLKFDYSFALHNNPNYPSGKIIIHRGTYAPASVGLEFIFKGKASHAAYPEKADSPLGIITEIVTLINSQNNDLRPIAEFVLGTVVNIILGENNYGVTPGYGELRLTLRANQNQKLIHFKNQIIDKATDLSKSSNIELLISEHDYFPATINDLELTNLLESITQKMSFDVIFPESPTRGSDDFSHFSQISRTLFFDIGSGPGADIHQPEFKFDDNIILPAVKLLVLLIKELN